MIIDIIFYSLIIIMVLSIFIVTFFIINWVNIAFYTLVAVIFFSILLLAFLACYCIWDLFTAVVDKLLWKLFKIYRM